MSTAPTYSTSALVASLSFFKRDDLFLAGGKGANLGELSHMGFAVPPGFVITTAAYDLLLQANGAQEKLRTILTSLDVERPDSVPEVSQQIHELFQHISIPSQLT